MNNELFRRTTKNRHNSSQPIFWRTEIRGLVGEGYDDAQVIGWFHSIGITFCIADISKELEVARDNCGE